MITLKNAWEGLKLTWAEWHSIVIGWGDGVAFHKTEWHRMDVYYPESEKMEQEYHYYQFGLALGRLTLVLIGASLLIRFLG